MGETEVTQELFEAVMGANPSYFNGTSGREAAVGETQNQRPVETVNWYHAIAFCNKLSLADNKEPVYRVNGISDWAGLAYSAIPTSDNADWNAVVMENKNGYRLPTEMEWMWAAMGAEQTSEPNISGYGKDFSGSSGSNNIEDSVWYWENSDSRTHETGRKAGNELGLKDMSGNVWEWCWDWIDSYDYPAGALTDYTGPELGSYRVLRGGAWSNGAFVCTVATRNGTYPYYRNFGIGFRVVAP